MKINKLSIVIPAYNEAKTIEAILQRVAEADLGVAKEIIVINDGSSDNSKEVLDRYRDKYVIIHFSQNQGKGAGVAAGYQVATGDYIVVQDADLEYDPNDLKKLINEVENCGAQAVYGSRRLGLTRKKSPKAGWFYYLGGVYLTWLTNFLYGTAITDEATCYKMVSKQVLDKINIKAKGFEFCPEVTAKISRQGVKIYEVPISYIPRSQEEGKKIKLRDGLIAIWTLIKYRF
ncbi:MAG: glycosyltransferase family 2 protein [Candidatus Buchananbacteria bacterium]